MSEQNKKPEIQIVKVQSRFSRMALREGGISADDAVAAADSFVESQRSIYFDWVADDLAMLEGHVEALHQSNGADTGNQDAAYYKSAHIRDLGGTFGYSVITETANSLCELLYRLKTAGLYNREAVNTHLGAMKMVCARDVATMPEATQQVLLQGLKRVVDKFPRPLPEEAPEAAEPTINP